MSQQEKIIIEEVNMKELDSPVVSEDMKIPFDSLRVSYDPKSKNKTKQQRDFEQLQRLLRQEDSLSPSSNNDKRSSFDSRQESDSKQPLDIDFLNVTKTPKIEPIEFISSPVQKKDDLDEFMTQWEELSELFDYKEFELIKSLEFSFKKISKKVFQIEKNWMEIIESNRLDIIQECIENIEMNSKLNFFDSLKTLLYISLGCFCEIETDSKKIQIYQMKENFNLLSKTNLFDLIFENSLFFIHSILRFEKKNFF